MFDINEVNDFIASNCLTHGRCPVVTNFTRLTNTATAGA